MPPNGGLVDTGPVLAGTRRQSCKLAMSRDRGGEKKNGECCGEADSGQATDMGCSEDGSAETERTEMRLDHDTFKGRENGKARVKKGGEEETNIMRGCGEAGRGQETDAHTMAAGMAPGEDGSAEFEKDEQRLDSITDKVRDDGGTRGKGGRKGDWREPGEVNGLQRGGDKPKRKGASGGGMHEREADTDGEAATGGAVRAAGITQSKASHNGSTSMMLEWDAGSSNGAITTNFEVGHFIGFLFKHHERGAA